MSRIRAAADDETERGFRIAQFSTLRKTIGRVDSGRSGRSASDLVSDGPEPTTRSLTVLDVSTSPAPLCVGDCDGGGSVIVSELITMVNIALGNAQPPACQSGIPNGAEVNIALLIQAVISALNGCSG